MSNKDKSSPNMEIERKFIPKKLPDHLDQYPFHDIEQGMKRVLVQMIRQFFGDEFAFNLHVW